MKNILFLMLGMSLLSIQAFAKNCKKVQLEVKNSFRLKDEKEPNYMIKVFSIHYKDGKKWRFENVKNKEIDSGKSHTFTENLEFVGGEKIDQFYVKFKIKTGGKWSKSYKSNFIQAGKKCSDGVKYKLVLASGKRD